MLAKKKTKIEGQAYASPFEIARIMTVDNSMRSYQCYR